jgi:hypothetical protein
MAFGLNLGPLGDAPVGKDRVDLGSLLGLMILIVVPETARWLVNGLVTLLE